jgi:hypothetical protein
MEGVKPPPGDAAPVIVRQAPQQAFQVVLSHSLMDRRWNKKNTAKRKRLIRCESNVDFWVDLWTATICEKKMNIKKTSLEIFVLCNNVLPSQAQISFIFQIKKNASKGISPACF